VSSGLLLFEEDDDDVLVGRGAFDVAVGDEPEPPEEAPEPDPVLPSPPLSPPFPELPPPLLPPPLIKEATGGPGKTYSTFSSKIPGAKIPGSSSE